MVENHLGVDLVLLLYPLRQFERQAELAFQLAIQRGDVPLLVDALGRHMRAHHRLHDVLADIGHGGGHVLTLKQLIALAVNHLTLVVGDVVEFQQVLTDVEVVLLDLALGLLDLPADHAIFQRVVVLHAEALHPADQALAAEDAQQVVFQRQVEARRTRIALAARTTAQLVVDAARLVALGADDVQADRRKHLLVQLFPFGLDALAVDLGGVFGQLGHGRLEAAAEHDIGAAAGHVGGDGHLAWRTGLGDDVRLALVLLGVEHLVRDLGLGQKAGQQLGHFDRGGTHQHRLAALVARLDVFDHRAVFRLLRQEDHVRVVLADHRLVGWDHHHLQTVDTLELERFGVSGAGHAGQLLVHAEQVLERHRGERLILTLDRHAFLRLDGLMQAVGPAAPGQGTTGEFVNDDDLTVAHDVIHVALVNAVRPQRRVEVMHHGQILRIV